MSAAERRPESTSSAIVTRCCGVSFGRRPPTRPSARGDKAGADPIAGSQAIELGQADDELGRCPSARSRGVDHLRQAEEARAYRANTPHRPHGVGQGAAQAMNVRHHDNVARAHPFEQAVQLRLFVLSIGGRVLADLIASCLLQSLPLRSSGVRVALFDPAIADPH